LSDAETETCTAKFACSGLVDLAEILPDCLEVLFTNANARVHHIDTNAFTAVRAPRHHGDASTIGELHRIREQVEQHLTHFRAICVERWALEADVDDEIQ